MNKLFLVALVAGIFASNASASFKYECNRYVNGNYEGFIMIYADNKAEAERKAYDKYKNKLGYKVDYVKCK